jgi:hypothetical protein
MTDGPLLEPIYWSKRFAAIATAVSVGLVVLGLFMRNTEYRLHGFGILVCGIWLLLSNGVALLRKAPALEVSGGELLYRRLTVRRRNLADLQSVMAVSGRDIATAGGGVRLEFQDARGFSVPFRWLDCDRKETLARLSKLRREHGAGSSIGSVEQ